MKIKILSKKCKDVQWSGGNFTSYELWALANKKEFAAEFKEAYANPKIIGEQIQLAKDKEGNENPDEVTFNISSNAADFDKIEKFDVLDVKLAFVLNKKGERYNIYIKKVMAIEKSTSDIPSAEWCVAAEPTENKPVNLPPVEGADDLPF